MFAEKFENRLKAQKKAGLYRNPPCISGRAGKTVTIGGKTLVNFASNDYLGLAQNRELTEAAAENFRRYGNSASSSRLVSAHMEVITEAENRFAAFFGHESALFFSSGFQTNLAVVSTLFGEGDAVFFDKHVHASTVKGLTMSKGTIHGYRHNSMTHLKKRYESHAGECNAVVTEALFSMDGDSPDFPALKRFKEETGALIVVDEAHSFGILGEKGRGLSSGVADVAIGAFGKSFGFFGGFALMPGIFREYLFNFASPLIYSTCLPAAHAATAACILEKASRADSERDHVRKLGAYLKERLNAARFEYTGDGPIMAVMMGDADKAMAAAMRLREHGILAFPARYPTVPVDKAIIRVSVNALMEYEDMDLFADALMKIREAL